jgi:hypothetical protein
MIPGIRVPPRESKASDTPQAQILLLSHASRIILWILVILGLLGTGVAFTIAFLRWNFAFSHYGPAVVWQWAAPALIAGALFSLVWLAALLYWAIQRHHFAWVHAEGVTLQRGRRRAHFPWEKLVDLNLSVVQYGLPFWKWGSHSSASLSTQNGNLLRFQGRMRELDTFTNAIKHYLYPQRLREYRQMLEGKETINFGPLKCSSDGLTFRKKQYTWDKVISANLDSGRLIISIENDKGNATIQIPAKKISNPDLCAQLIKNIEY